MRTISSLTLVVLAMAGQALAQEQAPCPKHVDRARGLELRLSRPAGDSACRVLELYRGRDGKRIARRELPADPLALGLGLGPARAGKVLLEARYDFWSFDLVEGSLSGPFRPCVPEGQDAQSGNLQSLAWLADHLVAGKAVDRGRFVFALDKKPRELVPTGSWSAHGPCGLDCPHKPSLSLFTDPKGGRMLGLIDDRLAFRSRRLRPAKVLVGAELGECRPRKPVPAPQIQAIYDRADRLRGLVLTELGPKSRRSLVFDPVAGKLLTLTGKTPVVDQLAQQAAGVALRLWQGRRYAKAADTFAMALDLAPHNSAWRLQQAAVLALAGRADDAVRSLAAAARQDLEATRRILRKQRAFAAVIQRPEVRTLLTSDDPVYPAPAAQPGPAGLPSLHPIGWSPNGKFAWAEAHHRLAGRRGLELWLKVMDVDKAELLLAWQHPGEPVGDVPSDFETAWADLPAGWIQELARHEIVPAVGVELRPFPARTGAGLYNAWLQPAPEGTVALMSSAPSDKPKTVTTTPLPPGTRCEPPHYLKSPFGDLRVLVSALPTLGADEKISHTFVLEPI